MKQIAAVVFLAVLPLEGLAEDSVPGLEIDPSIVRDCFATADHQTLAATCLGQASEQCQALPAGWTNVGMVQCISAETAEWDAILNEEYAATQAFNVEQDAAGHSPIMDRTDTLRDAQRAWIAFRDADCAAQYAFWQEGSNRSLVAALCHLTHTATRAVDLRDLRGY